MSSYFESKVETFDDFYESERAADYSLITPFQYRDEDEPLLDWLTHAYELAVNAGLSRFRTYRKNIDLYKGIHWKGEISTKRSPKQSVNFVFEMTEAKVSNLAVNKISFSAVPRHNEQQDVNNAKAAKLLLDARCKEIGFDSKNTEFDRLMMQLGHSYFWIDWDRTAGGLHPLLEEAAELSPDLLSKIQKRTGRNSIYVGDVSLEVLGANRVFPEMGKKRLHEDIDYVDIVDEKHIDELKKKYPKFADDIHPSASSEFGWKLNSEEETVANMCVVHTFLHRHTEFMPKGRRIVWVKGHVLEDGDLGLKHGKIPLVDDRDISIKDEFHGRSSYSNIYNLQRFYNLIQSAQARDFTIASAPKWLVAKGSIKPTAVNNDLSIMEFTGPTPPKLVSHNPTSTQGFELQDRLEKKISKMMAVYDMSRGDTPQGVTANSALRFLDEQEGKRVYTTIANRNKRIIDTLNLMLCAMSQFYREDDGRMIREVGEDNSYLVRDLSKTDFSKVYSIELQKTSALPDTKTGKIATIIDLNQVTQTDPVFKRDEIIEMLDLGLDKAFINRSTVGINAARSVLESILRGEEVEEPQMYDSLITHYGVLTDALEENWFKKRVVPEIQQKISERVKVIEGLMWIRAKNNMKFAQEVMMLSKYPIFFTPPIPISQFANPAPMPDQAAPVNNQDLTTINQQGDQL